MSESEAIASALNPVGSQATVVPANFDRTENMGELLHLLPSLHAQPGWAKAEPSLWPTPRKNFLPAKWAYESARAALNAAGRFVSTEKAERRNLILTNPLVGNTYPTVRTIVSAYQMVRAGEVARSHRHTPNALRLIVETGSNAFTVVNGQRIPMEPGDIVLTPNWQWHGHANESDRDAYWIDFLDVPTVHFLESMFLENHRDWVEAAEPVVPDSPLRFRKALTEALLDAAAPAAGLRKVTLATPQLKTMGLQVWRIDSMDGIDGVDAGRSTASAVFAVMEGEGRAEVDGVGFDLRRGDVLAVPSWRPSTLRTGSSLTLLRVSDEPMLSALGWLRREDGTTA